MEDRSIGWIWKLEGYNDGINLGGQEDRTLQDMRMEASRLGEWKLGGQEDRS